MLLHVVFAGEGLVALWAEGVLLAGVLFGVAGSVARGGEVVVAVELLGHGARVAVLLWACVVCCCGGGLVFWGLLGAEVGGMRGGGIVVGQRGRGLRNRGVCRGQVLVLLREEA